MTPEPSTGPAATAAPAAVPPATRARADAPASPIVRSLISFPPSVRGLACAAATVPRGLLGIPRCGELALVHPHDPKLGRGDGAAQGAHRPLCRAQARLGHWCHHPRPR